MIRSLGVRIETGTKLGRDFTLKILKDKGYEAVFLGLGAPLGAKLGIKGEEAEGVMDGIKFLREFNLKGKLTAGKHVAVIGGGNVAVDVARTALRLGAEEVTVLYRRTREEMPAYGEEVREALNEGVKFEFLVAPTEIVVEGGKAAGVKCNRMVLGEFDKSGRRRPKEKSGDEFTAAADQVIAAIGQALDPSEINNGISLAFNRSRYIESDPVTAKTSVDWVFAGGDAVTGPASVIEAIGAGEKAAVGISRFLTGKADAFWREHRAVDSFFDPDAAPVPTTRTETKLIPVKARRNNFREVEIAWSEKTAVCEAKRCLRCDYKEAD
jgi:NADH-quinone oxidoreductase subunit F